VGETLITTLGGRIREARRAAGYTNVEQLAVVLGVGQRTVQRWETDRSEPSLSLLRQIAAATGEPLSYFFQGQKEGERRVSGPAPDTEV
jgi:transcriptional regulator with XRE-family HTH domain